MSELGEVLAAFHEATGCDASVWRRDGGELYYRSDNKMMAVSVSTGAQLTASAPRLLWDASYSAGTGASCGMPGVSSSNYDVTADGKRFLMVRDDDESVMANKIVVVLNWAEQLKTTQAAAARSARAD